MIYIMQSDFP